MERTNVSGQKARMLCMCSPAGQEEFFMAIRKAVASGTASAPEPTDADKAEFMKKAEALAPRYRTELLRPSAWRRGRARLSS